MKKNRLKIKVLVLFMLWIGGMNIMACDGYYLEILDKDGFGTGVYKCLSKDGTGTAYCAFEGLGAYPIEGGGIECDPDITVYDTPLTGASFFLIFLLGIYGTYLYRKRVVLK